MVTSQTIGGRNVSGRNQFRNLSVSLANRRCSRRGKTSITSTNMHAPLLAVHPLSLLPLRMQWLAEYFATGRSSRVCHCRRPANFAHTGPPGNNRVDSFHNLIANPKIGILFLGPGHPHSLRVDGTTRLLNDDQLCQRLAMQVSRPELCLRSPLPRSFFIAESR